MSRLLATGTLLIAGALLAPAQSSRLERHDRNGDGVVTRSEWRGNDNAFDRQDMNNDGVLSGDELTGQQRSRSRNRTADRAADRLDKNDSGVVEGYEWPYNSRIFRQLDKDGDSVLSTDELGNLNTAALSQLDQNRNREIDEDEWPGGFAQFDKLDDNRDGKVSSSEYFERGGEWQRRQRFDSWDKNRNGVIESTEWQTSAALFRRLDTSGDSVVSWEEFTRSTEQYDKPFGWR
jgi:Ca2+-binding EF-hand superfamily protein